MCTVSFVRSDGKVFITSNRDEKVNRPALEPRRYLVGNKILVFPKDPKAGGTWFVATEEGTVLVLLNGAAEKHQVKDSYKRSRGLIALDIAKTENPLTAWKSISLEDVEPFTLVLYFNNDLYQLRWDGFEKEFIKLNSFENYIWSSSTLYSKEIREMRQEWFSKYMLDVPNCSADDILQFHQHTQDQNQENGFVINRNELLKTLSISQTEIDQNKVEVNYHDLIEKRSFKSTFITI